MAVDGQRQSLETQRRENLLQLEKQRKAQIDGIRNAANEQQSSLEASAAENVTKLMESKASLESQVGALESALSEMPADHPQRPELQKRLRAAKKSLSFINSQLSMIKFRVQSQNQMIKFQAKMREQMLDIRFSSQKSLLMRRFAEMFMQLQANQEQMAAMRAAYAMAGQGGAQQRKPAEAKESGTQKG